MGQARHATLCHPLHTTTSLVAPTDKSNRLGTVACEERPVQGTPSSQHLGLPKTPAGGGVSSPCPAKNKERGLLPALSLACYQPRWFNKAGESPSRGPRLPTQAGATPRRCLHQACLFGLCFVGICVPRQMLLQVEEPDTGGPTGCEPTCVTRPGQGRGSWGPGGMGVKAMETVSFWGDGTFWTQRSVNIPKPTILQGKRFIPQL